MKIVELIARVEVPVNNQIVVVTRNKTAQECEKLFEERGKREVSSLKKQDYERCRLMLNWAATCNAILKNVLCRTRKGGFTIEFNFAFQNVKTLSKFVEGVERKVEDSLID